MATATEPKAIKALYIPTSTNTKTGNIPQQFIGLNLQETRESCNGCPLFKIDPSKKSTKKHEARGGLQCYAWSGFTARGAGQLQKAHARGKDKSIEYALDNRLAKAKYVRFGAFGDPSRMSHEDFDHDEKAVEDAGLQVIGYTHFADTDGQHLKGRLLASCDTIEDAIRLSEEGWRTALHLPKDEIPARAWKSRSWKSNDISFVQCPEQYRDVTCNQCGMCAAKDPRFQKVDVIVFAEH